MRRTRNQRSLGRGSGPRASSPAPPPRRQRRSAGHGGARRAVQRSIDELGDRGNLAARTLAGGRSVSSASSASGPSSMVPCTSSTCPPTARRRRRAPRLARRAAGVRPTATFQYDVDGFLADWLEDLGANQSADGAVAIAMPSEPIGFTVFASSSDAATIVPWGPGYRQLHIAPGPGRGVRSAECTLRTPYGQAGCRWSVDGTRVLLDVELSPNSRRSSYAAAATPTSSSSTPEWDLDGAGDFAERDTGPAASSVYERRASFAEPGTLFVTVRVGAHRDADATSPYAAHPQDRSGARRGHVRAENVVLSAL